MNWIDFANSWNEMGNQDSWRCYKLKARVETCLLVYLFAVCKRENGDMTFVPETRRGGTPLACHQACRLRYKWTLYVDNLIKGSSYCTATCFVDPFMLFGWKCKQQFCESHAWSSAELHIVINEKRLFLSLSIVFSFPMTRSSWVACRTSRGWWQTALVF